VTYGSQLLPLLAIEDVVKVAPRAPSPRFFGVVCRSLDREFGVAVSRIVDVVDSLAPVDGATHVQPGILGSLVVDGQVVLLLDVLGIVGALLPEYRKAAPPVPTAGEEEAPLVLVVEDSPFFRKQMVTALQEAGFQTIAAADGEEGLALLEQNVDRVRLVITDIEMPRLDGLSMTRRIRRDQRHRELPVLAVTSLSGEAAEREGRDAGLSEYLIKLDREQIVERSHHYLGRRLAAGPRP
jgi:two-component system, chemotaxis family, sensor kinase CheA